MKKLSKLKIILVLALSAVLCLCAYALITNNNFKADTYTVNAETTEEKTSGNLADFGLQNANPIEVTTFNTEKSASLTFEMEAVAYVRINANSPGIRFKVKYSGATLDGYTAEYYVYFKNATKDSYILVKAKGVTSESTSYQASLTYPTDKLEEYKADQISAMGIIAFTKVGATENDTPIVVKSEAIGPATMEAVVNYGKLNNLFESYNEQVKTLMDEFAPSAETFISDSKIYAEKDDADGMGLKSTGLTDVETVYHGGKYIASSDTFTLSFVDVPVGEASEGYLSVKDSAGKFTNVPYIVADKVIRELVDLETLYGARGSVHNGYYVVANDIKWDNTFVAAPQMSGWEGLGNDSYTSVFAGVLDGDGHFVEYGVSSFGLFGTLKGRVKNISLIVKKASTAVGQYRSRAILASYINGATLENVYATYDIEDFTPDLTTGANYIGLSAYAADATYKNVVVDLSRVDGINDADVTEGSYYFGVPMSYRGFDNSEVLNVDYPCTTENVHIITPAKKIVNIYYTKPNESIVDYTRYASNDATLTADESEVLAGVYRHDDYASAKTYFAKAENQEQLTAFGDGVDTSFGLPYGGNVLYVADTLGTTYYDGVEDTDTGDVAYVLPTGLDIKNITKIVNVNDESEVYYNGADWSVDANTGNTKISHTAFIYGENDALLGVTEIIVAKKVISRLEDLKSLAVYDSMPTNGTTTTTSGYFVVSNNIMWDNAFVAKPKFRAWNMMAESVFSGTLDGDGHTVEYGVEKGGLFGSLKGTVKNIFLVVKKATSTTDTNQGYADNAIIATWIYNAKIENVYATYDIDNFAPTLSKGGNSLGLAALTHNSTFTNVILDLSKVQGVQDKINNNQVSGYGVLCSARKWDAGSYTPGTSTNVHLIWTVKEISTGTNCSATYVASNDTVENATSIAGITRHNNLEDMATALNGAKVGNFVVSSTDVTWSK